MMHNKNKFLLSVALLLVLQSVKPTSSQLQWIPDFSTSPWKEIAETAKPLIMESFNNGTLNEGFKFLKDEFTKKCSDAYQKLFPKQKDKNWEPIFQNFANTVITGSFYDLVVASDSLKGLGSDGWTLSGENTTKFYHTLSGSIVGFLGLYDTGKTRTMNRLLDGTLPEGVNIATQGLSLIYKKGLFWLDSAGFSRAATSENLSDRYGTDAFIEDMVIQLSDFVVFVVDALHLNDIKQIDRVWKKVVQFSTNPQSPKRLIVAHNFWRYSELLEVQKHIQDDIVSAFGAVESDPNTEIPCPLYFSHNNLVTHVVFARDNTPAGVHYNKCSSSQLQMFLNGGLFQKREINVVQEIKTLTENVLPKYFYPPGSSGDDFPAPATNGLFENFNQLLTKLKKTISDGLIKMLYPDPQNPWEIDATQQNRVMKLKKSASLIYLPFYDADRPNAELNPEYSVFHGPNYFRVEIDVPGYNVTKSECPIGSNILSVTVVRVPSGESKFKDLLPGKSANPRRFGAKTLRVAVPLNVHCSTFLATQTLTDGTLVFHAETNKLEDEL